MQFVAVLLRCTPSALNWRVIDSRFCRRMSSTLSLHLLLYSCRCIKFVHCCMQRLGHSPAGDIRPTFSAICCLSAKFLPRDVMLAHYMLWPCVRPSICRSHVGILSKRLKISNWFSVQKFPSVYPTANSTSRR